MLAFERGPTGVETGVFCLVALCRVMREIVIRLSWRQNRRLSDDMATDWMQKRQPAKTHTEKEKEKGKIKQEKQDADMVNRQPNAAAYQRQMESWERERKEDNR